LPCQIFFKDKPARQSLKEEDGFLPPCLAVPAIMDSTSETPSGVLRVLVVDDTSIHRRLACRLLERRGCDVTARVDGRQAVNLLRQQDFDIVLMDVEMPEMDGLQATTLLRTWEGECGQHTPVIAVTSTKDPDICFEAGMDGYVSKPLTFESLEETLAPFEK
jgi:CheY-like chemotaxis protein